jgi:hypothetical protein
VPNTNHNFDNFEIEFDTICLKCKSTWIMLYIVAQSRKSINKQETKLEFINRVYPCLTDEEALIKKALE